MRILEFLLTADDEVCAVREGRGTCLCEFFSCSFWGRGFLGVGLLNVLIC